MFWLKVRDLYGMLIPKEFGLPLIIGVLGLTVVGCTTQMETFHKTIILSNGETVDYVAADVGNFAGLNSRVIDRYLLGKDGKAQLIARDHSSGDGILNGALKGAVGSAALAGGFAGGMALRRPDSFNISQTGGYAGVDGVSGGAGGAGGVGLGGAGGLGGSATATGGAGGAGGAGGRGGAATALGLGGTGGTAVSFGLGVGSTGATP